MSDSGQFCREIASDSDSNSDYDIVLMSTEGSVGHKNYWIADLGATCHMGPSLDGCTDIVYVNDRVIVVNEQKSVCKERATFNGVAFLKNGKERKIVINNYVYVPNLTDYLFSII